ncbi:hypothetical protein ACPCXF_17580 [Lysinibacillus agricola]
MERLHTQPEQFFSGPEQFFTLFRCSDSSFRRFSFSIRHPGLFPLL